MAYYTMRDQRLLEWSCHAGIIAGNRSHVDRQEDNAKTFRIVLLYYTAEGRAVHLLIRCVDDWSQRTAKVMNTK